MTIDELYKSNKISVRIYNVCRYNGIHTILDLKKYYYRYKTFNKLKNCGKKSSDELMKICNSYNDIKYKPEWLQEELFETEESILKKVVLNLTRIQRDIINSFIFISTDNLTNRSKNTINIYLNNNLKIRNFSEKILCSISFQLSQIKNVGTKTKLELEIYIQKIKHFLLEVSKNEEEKELTALKNSFLIQKKFSIFKIPKEILESESIFTLINFFIQENAFFDESQTMIFEKGLNIYQNTKDTTLEAIGVKVNLTRERVRQIRLSCFKKLFEKLSFIKNFNDDLLQNYNIDTTLNFININEELIELVNRFSKTKFSREFIIYTLYVYLYDDYKLVGNEEDALILKSFNASKRHNWNSIYLVKKDLVKKYDFDLFVEDVNSRLSEKIKETYVFNFKSYLSKFLKEEGLSILDEITPFAEHLINNEFEIFIDIEDNITFQRNTSKQAYEYAYEALGKLNKPSKVKEIYDKVIELYPSYNTDESKIRSSMKRKNGFLPIGRTSVFALRKWEQEKEGFKGGTIRSIIMGYLEELDDPKHISDISTHVLKYRPTSNASSILQNLKLDESGLFVFFKFSHIGLSHKKYNSKFIQAKESSTIKRDWEESYTLLLKFIDKENRMPYSTKSSEDEQILYRWFNVQKRKMKKGKLDDLEIRLINEIFIKFPQSRKRRRSNSDEKYIKLIEFVKRHGHPPSSNKKEERILYQFFYKQRKLFEINELFDNDKDNFHKIIQLLQQNKV